MAVDADVRLDLEMLMHLDGDDAEACDLFEESCDDPATWRLRHHCCGATWPTCTTHKAKYIELEKEFRAEHDGGKVFRCCVCHSVVVPIENSDWEATR